nr:hypothetical protein [Candidatus Njordarchaeota archaeon]
MLKRLSLVYAVWSLSFTVFLWLLPLVILSWACLVYWRIHSRGEWKRHRDHDVVWDNWRTSYALCRTCGAVIDTKTGAKLRNKRKAEMIAWSYKSHREVGWMRSGCMRLGGVNPSEGCWIREVDIGYGTIEGGMHRDEAPINRRWWRAKQKEYVAEERGSRCL